MSVLCCVLSQRAENGMQVLRPDGCRPLLCRAPLARWPLGCCIADNNLVARQLAPAETLHAIKSHRVQSVPQCPHAAVMAHIRKREKELGITPDPQLDALTQQAQLGKEGTSVIVYLM